MVSLDDQLTSRNEATGHVALDFADLREWLINNPYNSEAPERVRAVVAFSCRHLFPHMGDDGARLEKIAQMQSSEGVYQEFRNDSATRDFDNLKEGDEDDED